MIFKRYKNDIKMISIVDKLMKSKLKGPKKARNQKPGKYHEYHSDDEIMDASNIKTAKMKKQYHKLQEAIKTDSDDEDFVQIEHREKEEAEKQKKKKGKQPKNKEEPNATGLYHFDIIYLYHNVIPFVYM